MHEVLVNRLGGLSLPRKSVVRLTDRPEMTLDVYRGRKTTIQQQQQHRDLEAQASTYMLLFNIFSSELNVNGYPFKRSNSPQNKGQLVNGKNLLLQSKFFPLRVDPIQERLPHAGKQRESKKKLFLFKNGKGGQIFLCKSDRPWR